MFLGNTLCENHIRYILILYSCVYLLVMTTVKGYTFTDIRFPKNTISRNNVVINDNFFSLLAKKKINYVKGNIIQFHKNSVELEINNTRIQSKPDLIIMATGYDKSISYLKLTKPPIYLYNRILHPKFMSLGFIGFIMSVFWIPTSELQAKWFINYIIGKIPVPSKTEILSYLVKEQQYYKTHISYDYYDYAFRSFDYCDSLSKELGIHLSSSDNKLTYWLSPLTCSEWNDYSN